MGNAGIRAYITMELFNKESMISVITAFSAFRFSISVSLSWANVGAEKINVTKGTSKRFIAGRF